MCGVVLMKLCGSGSAPIATRYAQYWRLTWNCSLIETALAALDGAVGVLGHVVELAEGRVAGARVVPRVRGLLCDLAESLVDADAPVGLELRDEGAERRAHDAPADEHDVDGFL